MYCPECKIEYQEGITSCERCSVDLIKESGYKEIEVDLVTIVRIMDREKAEKIEDILKANQIFCCLNNFKSTTIGNGGSIHTITLPVEVQVPKKDIENAVKIIQQSNIDVYAFAAKINIEQSTDPASIDDSIPKKTKTAGFILGCYIIIMVAAEIISNLKNGFWIVFAGVALLVGIVVVKCLFKRIKRSSNNNLSNSQQ